MAETLPLKAWLLAIPGGVLWALAIAVLLRAAIEIVAGAGAGGVVARLLSALTAPIVGPARALAPRLLPPLIVYVFAVGWLIVFRMLWIIVSGALGLRGSFGT